MKAVVGMVGSNDPELGRLLREQLLHAGFFCEMRHVVEVSLLIDRASLEQPELIVIVQSGTPEEEGQLLRELSMVTSSHIIVIGSAVDPRRIMAAMHAGANEYLDIDTWQAMLLESIVRLRTRASHRIAFDDVAKVIGIAAPSGGVGASTIAANVATVLAGKHKSAMLIDLHFEAGDLAPILDLRPSFSLADLSANLNRLDQALFEQILTPHSSGVQLLAAPQDYSSIERITIKGFRRALAFGKRKFPYVVMDLGVAQSALHQEALMQCDVLAVVLRLDYPSIRNTRRFIEYVVSLGYDTSKIKLVVNHYGQSRQIKLAQAQEALGYELDVLLPEDAASLNYATNSGTPIVTAKPRATISRRLVELASSLNGRHVAE